MEVGDVVKLKASSPVAVGQFSHDNTYVVSYVSAVGLGFKADDSGSANIGWVKHFFELVEEFKIQKHTVERYAVIFYNTRLQKIRIEFKNTADEMKFYVEQLERNGHTVLKKSKLKFEVELPEGVNETT